MNEKTRQQAIEILAATPAPACEALIRQFVWANTAAPKYKIGDPVKFVDPGVTIKRNIRLPGGGWDHQGRRAGEVIGRVTEVKRVLQDQTFRYTVEYETDLEEGEVGGKRVTSHTAFRSEKDLRAADAYAPTKWSDLPGR
ncbi:MAG: hypothetical protein J6Q14_00590 [Oscillospiraceae bacterium]|nr:hypothetical protein [Oscillospiraceae bacterium]